MLDEHGGHCRADGGGAYDVFVDLSETSLGATEILLHVKTLSLFCGFDVLGVHLTAAVPEKFELARGSNLPWRFLHGPAALGAALNQAAARRRALLVIVGAVLVPNECVPLLFGALAEDPMFGVAQPRFGDPSHFGVFGLPGSPDEDEEGGLLVRRAALPLLPDTVISAEMLSACSLLSPLVVDSLAYDVPRGFESASGALLAALVAARRRGFRNVVSNRAVVPVKAFESAYPDIADADYSRLIEWRPDHEKARCTNQLLAARALERAVATPLASDGRLRMLIDCRGLAPMHNGTSICILGFLDGLASEAKHWEITVLVQEASLAFHDFRQRYPEFTHFPDGPTESYAVALLPNQPWRLSTIAELHRHSCVVAFNMLDTIAWDIVYPADEHVEAAWHFLAQHADGIAYDSRFTQMRMNRRFPVAPGRIERVVHLSLSASDHCHPDARLRAQADHVLLFGNSYDHKDIEPTLRMLTDGFPDQPFVVIGGEKLERLPANVTTIPSGNSPVEKIHELIASAKCVVYPSFYEGFGLPLVESLSYGRVVFARSSPLWEEIVAHSRLPGQVVPYGCNMELFELLGRHLAGDSLPALSSGHALEPQESPVDWKQSAARMAGLLRECLDRADPAQWLRREIALRSAGH